MSAGTHGTYLILIEVKGAVEAGNQIKSITNSLTRVDTKIKQSFYNHEPNYKKDKTKIIT